MIAPNLDEHLDVPLPASASQLEERPPVSLELALVIGDLLSVHGLELRDPAFVTPSATLVDPRRRRSTDSALMPVAPSGLAVTHELDVVSAGVAPRHRAVTLPFAGTVAHAALRSLTPSEELGAVSAAPLPSTMKSAAFCAL